MDPLVTASNIPSTGNIFKNVCASLPRPALAAVLPFTWQYAGLWILPAPYSLLFEISGQVHLWIRGINANMYYFHLLFRVDMAKLDLGSKHHLAYFF